MIQSHLYISVSNILFKKGWNKILKVVIRNIIYTILLSIIPIFFGLVLSFLHARLHSDYLVLAYLQAKGVHYPSLAQYAATAQLLGFDQPLIEAFYKYLLELFTGNLGISVVISPDKPVIQFLTERIPASIEFTILPIVLGLIAGILLGILSVKVRYKLVKVFIQILIILSISMPMFFVGMWFQYVLAYQLGLFPVVGDPFLPSCILFLLTLFLTTRQVRSNYLKKSEEKHILSNSLQIIMNLSVLITSIFLLEDIFGLHGFFELFIDAIYDYWLFSACVIILIVLAAIILFLSNLCFTLYNFISEKNQSQIFAKCFGRSERMLEEGARYNVDLDQKFKDFVLYRLKSPLTIIGLAIVAFTIIVAIFPHVLTPLTLEQAMGIYPGSS